MRPHPTVLVPQGFRGGCKLDSPRGADQPGGVQPYSTTRRPPHPTGNSPSGFSGAATRGGWLIALGLGPLGLAAVGWPGLSLTGVALVGLGAALALPPRSGAWLRGLQACMYLALTLTFFGARLDLAARCGHDPWLVADVLLSSAPWAAHLAVWKRAREG